MPFRRTARVLDFQQFQEEHKLEESTPPNSSKVLKETQKLEMSEIHFAHDDAEKTATFVSSISRVLEQLKGVGRDHHFKCGDNEFVLDDKKVLVSSSHEIAVRRSKKSADKHSIYVKSDRIGKGAYAKVSDVMSYTLTGDSFIMRTQGDLVWKHYQEPEDESIHHHQETREACQAEYVGSNVAGLKTKRVFSGKGGSILFQQKQGQETLADYIERALYASASGYSKRICYLLSLKCLAEVGRFHEKGMIHGDIKPNNFSYSPDGKVKLIDFGESCKVGDKKEYKIVEGYAPPETDAFFVKLSGKPAYMTQAGDIYAMAFCLVNIWDCDASQTIAGRRLSPVFRRVNDISEPEKREITLRINAMFSSRLEERPTAAQVFQYFKALYEGCVQTNTLKK